MSLWHPLVYSVGADPLEHNGPTWAPFNLGHWRIHIFFVFLVQMALKAPKQSLSCQPQTLEGEGGSRGGGGTPLLLLRCTAGRIHHCPSPTARDG